MKSITSSLLAAPLLMLSLMSASALAQTDMPAAGKVSPADKMFFKKAAINGMSEVAAGKMAMEKGSSDEVKAFGKTMVDDHTKANDELKTLASSKGVMLPAAPDAKHQKMLDKLGMKSGMAFDMAYEKDQKMGHVDTIMAFKKASKSPDPDVAQFATSTLPTLKDHLAKIPGMGTMKMSSN